MRFLAGLEYSFKNHATFHDHCLLITISTVHSALWKQKRTPALHSGASLHLCEKKPHKLCITRRKISSESRRAQTPQRSMHSKKCSYCLGLVKGCVVFTTLLLSCASSHTCNTKSVVKEGKYGLFPTRAEFLPWMRLSQRQHFLLCRGANKNLRLQHTIVEKEIFYHPVSNYILKSLIPIKLEMIATSPLVSWFKNYQTFY